MNVTARMDISAGTVPAGPNLTGRMDPGKNTYIYGNIYAAGPKKDNIIRIGNIDSVR